MIDSKIFKNTDFVILMFSLFIKENIFSLIICLFFIASHPRQCTYTFNQCINQVDQVATSASDILSLHRKPLVSNNNEVMFSKEIFTIAQGNFNIMSKETGCLYVNYRVCNYLFVTVISVLFSLNRIL